LATELVASGSRDAVGIVRSCYDLCERGHIRAETLAQLWPAMKRASLVPKSSAIATDDHAAQPTAREVRDFITPARYLDLTSR